MEHVMLNWYWKKYDIEKNIIWTKIEWRDKEIDKSKWIIDKIN